MTDMTMNEWVRQARQHARMTQDELAEKMEMSKGNVSGWENGRHKPSFEQMKRISSLTGFPLPIDGAANVTPAPIGEPWVDSDHPRAQFVGLMQSLAESTTKDPARLKRMREEIITKLRIESNSQKIVSEGSIAAQPLTPSPSPGAPEVRVPLLANSGSMGMGSDLQHDDVLVGHIALSELWVMRRLRPTNASALRFIHAYGDSMSPTFEDGDILLVDTGMRDPKTVDGVYVMAANERVYIKRVRQRMDGAMEISSDNITVKTVDVLNGDHAIEILGRVVWCWNGRKL